MELSAELDSENATVRAKPDLFEKRAFFFFRVRDLHVIIQQHEFITHNSGHRCHAVIWHPIEEARETDWVIAAPDRSAAIYGGTGAILAANQWRSAG